MSTHTRIRSEIALLSRSRKLTLWKNRRGYFSTNIRWCYDVRQKLAEK
jgi:hypothetical protein